MRKVSPLAWAFSCLCYMLFLAATCEDDVQIGPRADEFTKEMREDIGGLIASTIVVNSTQYPLITEAPPFDSTYWYLQTLYNQATDFIKSDKSSATNNRWSQDREWKLYIINDDEKRDAFIVPGGQFFITSGMLKTIRNEYELYYLFTFEALLMNEYILLNRMIREYNALSLDNLITRSFPENGVTANIVASELPTLDYELEDLIKIDRLALEEICQTSAFDRFGLLPLLENPLDIQWFNTKSYSGRKGLLMNLEMEDNMDCGTIRTTGGYQQYVLNRLP